MLEELKRTKMEALAQFEQYAYEDKDKIPWYICPYCHSTFQGIKSCACGWEIGDPSPADATKLLMEILEVLSRIEACIIKTPRK